MPRLRDLHRSARWVLAHWSQGAGMHALLAVLLLQQVLRPLLFQTGHPGWTAAFGVVLVPAALLAADYRRRGVVVGLTVLLLAAAASRFRADQSLGRHMLANGFSLVLTGVLLWVTLDWIRRQRRVRLSSVSAALCGYLLIGATFTAAFDLLDVLTGTETVAGITPWDEVEAARGTGEQELLALQREMDLTYFSFVTLTTLGYGDLTPATPWARALATLEALLGQLYMVVLVAGLVGLHVAGLPRGPEEDPA